MTLTIILITILNLALGEFDDSLLSMGTPEGKPEVLLGADCFYR